MKRATATASYPRLLQPETPSVMRSPGSVLCRRDSATRLGLSGALALGCVLFACASGQVCRKDPITGSDRCQSSSGDYGEAAATAVAAGASWAVVGCTVNGCEPPYRCNAKTKMCERIACEEGTRSCPPGYSCDPEDKVCK